MAAIDKIYVENREQYLQFKEWCEEDEDMIQALNACIDAAIKSGMNYISFDSKSILIGKVKNWLKSLRPQNNITDEELTQAKKNAYNDALDKIEYHSGEPTFDDGWSAAIDYIRKKSIRPHSRWKPTELQLGCLSDTIEYYNSFGYPVPKLKELLDDLKKLKEE